MALQESADFLYRAELAYSPYATHLSVAKKL